MKVKMDVELDRKKIDEVMADRGLTVNTVNRNRFVKLIKNIPLSLAPEFWGKVTRDPEIFRAYGLALAGEENETAPAEASSTKNQVAKNVWLSQEEQGRLIARFGERQTNWMIDKLSLYKGSSGKKYQSDYQAILSWVVKAYEENHGRNGKAQNFRDAPMSDEELEKRLDRKRETINKAMER